MSVWVIAREYKKKTILGKIAYLDKRFYRNKRLNYLAHATCQFDDIAKFKTKDEAMEHLLNKWQKYPHELPKDYKPVRRNWE